jgi:hypothetical protein
MRTSGILTFGGAVLLVLGALGGLVFIGPLLKGSGGMFSNLMAMLILGAIPAAIGVALIAVGRKRARMETENDERNFSDMAMTLAKKNGGQVQVDAVCKASGLTRDEATARMRALTGRGLFDLDFDANGQMVWKISPDAGRAQLAEMAGRGG